MPTDAFKLTIHMVSSLDGFIAKKDNSISWFETADVYERGIDVTAQEAGAFLKTIDCYLMGARTYKHAVELSKSYGWPYGDTPTIVLTHSSLAAEPHHVEFYSGDLFKLINERLKPNFRSVWLAGGAELAKDFINSHLADEIRLSILPVILGDGIPFFKEIRQEVVLHLNNTVAYKNGIVELCYAINKTDD